VVPGVHFRLPAGSLFVPGKDNGDPCRKEATGLPELPGEIHDRSSLTGLVDLVPTTPKLFPLPLPTKCRHGVVPSG